MEQISTLLRSLNARQDTIRKDAEKLYHQIREQPGFGPALFSIILSIEAPTDLRIYAAVALHKFVKDLWTSEALSAEDRSQMKNMALQTINITPKPVHAKTAQVVGSIARYEMVSGWIELEKLLETSFSTADNTQVSNTAFSLSEICRELPASVSADFFFRFYSLLLRLFTEAQLEETTLVALLHALADVLRHLAFTPPDQQEAINIGVQQHLGGWVTIFSSILGGDVSHRMRNACLRCVSSIFSSFGELVTPAYAGSLLQPMWAYLSFFSSGRPPLDVAEGAETEPFTGDAVSLGSNISRVLSITASLVNSSRLSTYLSSNLEALLPLVLSYLRVSQSDRDSWNDDVDQFIEAEHDDSGVLLGYKSSPRLAARDLFAAVAQYLPDGPETCASQLEQFIPAAFSGTDSVTREAALFAAGLFGDAVLMIMDPDDPHTSQFFRRLVDSYVQPILQQGCEDPILYGRALLLSARVSVCLEEQAATYLMEAAARLLQAESTSPLLRITALFAAQTFCEQCGERRPAVIAPHVPLIMDHLAALLDRAEGCSESVRSVLVDSLHALTSASPEQAALRVPRLSGPLLQLIRESQADPLLSETIREIISLMAGASPQAAHAVRQAFLLPAFSLLAVARINAYAALTEALSLTEAVVTQPADEAGRPLPLQPEQASKLATRAFWIARNTDDEDILSLALSLLAGVLAAWRGEPVTIGERPLLGLSTTLIRSLLDDRREEAAAVACAPLSVLYRYHADKLGEQGAQLLTLVARRLRFAESRMLLEALVAVVSEYVIRVSPDSLISTVAGMPAPAPGSRPNLDDLLGRWLETAPRILTSRSSNISFLALLALLRATPRISPLMQVVVPAAPLRNWEKTALGGDGTKPVSLDIPPMPFPACALAACASQIFNAVCGANQPTADDDFFMLNDFGDEALSQVLGDVSSPSRDPIDNINLEAELQGWLLACQAEPAQGQLLQMVLGCAGFLPIHSELLRKLLSGEDLTDLLSN